MTTVNSTRLPIRQLTMLTRQMAMLLKSGSGVVPALNSLLGQFTKEDHVQMLRKIILDLEEGESFSNALRKFPRTFDSTYCAVVAAGEASARLPEMFSRLATMIAKRRVVRNKVAGAMAYPILLSFLSLAIASTLLFFVMPRFAGMFKTLDVDLPASTAFLLWLGDRVKDFWFVEVPGLLLLAVGLVYAVKSGAAAQWIQDVVTEIPLVGRLVSSLIQGETFRVLGMLMEARVGVLEAIDLVRGVTSNNRFQRLYDQMEAEVTSGGSISVALDNSGLIPGPICHAVHTGEESGQLGSAVSFIANVLDEDNTELIEMSMRLVEPVILIVMGFLVGGVAISLFMPLFDMTSAIS